MEISPSRITHSVVLVTPETAKNWLDNYNTHNRDLSELRVSQYIADMEGGLWKFNGEPIQFDYNSVLLNGQHRLTAVVRSALSQSFLIVRGLSPESQVTMDQGTRRTPKDQLATVDIKVDSSIAAAIRVFMRWQNGRLFGDLFHNKVTTSQVVCWAEGNPGLVQQLQDLASAGIKRAPCTPATALAIALRFSLIDEAACLQFFDKLISRENISGPVLALRNRLDIAHGTKVRFTERDVIGYFVTAWNAYRTNRPIQKLQRPKGNIWTVENFPEPK
jgi:hypothetical protein